jgi:hypothetical protein
MNRNQIYNDIASLNLKEEVKATYGKNYTNCSSEQLMAVINKAIKVKNTTKIQTTSPINKLIDVLYKKKILLKSEVDSILSK